MINGGIINEMKELDSILLNLQNDYSFEVIGHREECLCCLSINIIVCIFPRFY